MNKVLTALFCLLVLCACNNNKLVGTWESHSSDEVYESTFLGDVQKITYKSNGEYESVIEIQASIEDKKFNEGLTIKGTWEMIDDTHFRVKTTTAFMFGKEVPNETDETYTIVSLTDDKLITMNGGRQIDFIRLK